MQGVEKYINQIVQGDCLDIMKELPDKCIDLVYLDPPWPDSNVDIIGNDKPYELLEAFFNIAYKKAKTYIIHLGCNSDIRIMNCVPSNLAFFRNICLEYVCPHHHGRILYTHDSAYVFGEPPAARKGNFNISGRYTATDNDKSFNFHPCPRKLSHVKFLINKLSNENDLVVDPFGGSGVSAVACYLLKRRFICIEKEEKYVELSRKRLRDEMAQMRLDI
jgi:DNA modification methylase